MFVRSMEKIRGPRLCHLCKNKDFTGYGFNLICHKNQANRQLIGKVEPSSPAELAGLEEGDVVIEVNGYNVRGRTHCYVVNLIMSGFVDVKTGARIGDQVLLLVADPITDTYYRAHNLPIHSEAAINGQQRCSTSICVKLEVPRTPHLIGDSVVQCLNMGLRAKDMREWLAKKYKGKKDPRWIEASKLSAKEKHDLVKNL